MTRDVLATTWALFQRTWLPCLPLALLVTLSSLLMAPATGGTALDGGEFGWVTMLVASLIVLVLTLAIMLRQQAAVSASGETYAQSLLHSARRALPVLFTWLLYFLAIALGTMLLVLPGLAVVGWFSMAVTCATVEDRGPVTAIRRSIELVRGRFWRVLQVWLVGLASTIVFVILASVFINVIVSLAGSSFAVSTTGARVSQMLTLFVNTVPMLYMSALAVSLHAALENATDASDIAT